MRCEDKFVCLVGESKRESLSFSASKRLEMRDKALQADGNSFEVGCESSEDCVRRLNCSVVMIMFPIVERHCYSSAP